MNERRCRLTDALFFLDMTLLAQNDRYFTGSDGLQTHHPTMHALHPILGGEGGEITADGIVLDVGGEQPMQILAREVVNAAGLSAPAIARSLRGWPATPEAAAQPSLPAACLKV